MRTWALLVLGWLVSVVPACSTAHPLSEATRVPITDLGYIVGTWQGTSKRMPEMRDHAEVILIINEHAHFNFVSDRGTDLFLGTGSLVLSDGRAYGETAGGRGTLALHKKKAGDLILTVEVTLNDGYRYYLEMAREPLR
ncbi:MAG TPA: hypothetical protein VJ746_07380 [Nitrospira sp.]|nr:hypothetical protein [Nitrospira sp.]